MLLKALQRVKAAAASTPKWRLLLAALRAPSPRAEDRTHLQRLNLETPRTLQDRVARALLLRELSRLG